jgi:hypothetical protein
MRSFLATIGAVMITQHLFPTAPAFYAWKRGDSFDSGLVYSGLRQAEKGVGSVAGQGDRHR